MTVSSEEISGILDGVLSLPVKLYSLKVNQRPNHSLIEVVLDNLEHPYGSVSLLECEQVSRKLKEELERISPDLDYTLKVSSAGAERKLDLPGDLTWIVSGEYRFVWSFDQKNWKKNRKEFFES